MSSARRRSSFLLVLLVLCGLGGCSWFQSEQEKHIASLSDEESYNEAYRMVLSRQWQTAIERLTRIARDEVSNPYRDDAAFWLGYCYEESDDPVSAWQWYRRVVNRFPASPYVPKAGERLKALGF